MTNSRYGTIKVSGKDAKKFLQGQLTCDMDSLNQGQFCLAAHCNPKGRVVSLFYVYHAQDAYYLIVLREILIQALNQLKKYSIFFKSTLEDVSHQLFCIPRFHNTAVSEKLFFSISIDAHRSIDVCHQAQAPEVCDWSLYNIQNKIPVIYSDTTGKFMPHEIDLIKLGGVSFEKGCFTGQEIIARIHYRSKLNKTLVVADCFSEEQITRGIDVYNIKDNKKFICGSVIDSCKTSQTTFKVLLTVDDKAHQDNLYLDQNAGLKVQTTENTHDRTNLHCTRSN